MRKSRHLRKLRKNRRRKTLKKVGGFFDSIRDLFKTPPTPDTSIQNTSTLDTSTQNTSNQNTTASNPTINPNNKGGKTSRSRSSKKM
jgi:hypothetical protein